MQEQFTRVRFIITFKDKWNELKALIVKQILGWTKTLKPILNFEKLKMARLRQEKDLNSLDKSIQELKQLRKRDAQRVKQNAIR